MTYADWHEVCILSLRRKKGEQNADINNCRFGGFGSDNDGL